MLVKLIIYFAFMRVVRANWCLFPSILKRSPNSLIHPPFLEVYSKLLLELRTITGVGVNLKVPENRANPYLVFGGSNLEVAAGVALSYDVAEHA